MRSENPQKFPTLSKNITLRYLYSHISPVFILIYLSIYWGKIYSGIFSNKSTFFLLCEFNPSVQYTIYSSCVVHIITVIRKP